MNYTTTNIAQICGGKRHETTAKLTDFSVKYLALDSRHILFPGQSIFFAIVGERHDGHAYISEVYAKGVRCFIVSQNVDYQLFSEAIFIQVDNTTDALQALTQHHRSRFNLPIIGITGSNGKTIVKEWLFQVLHPYFHIVRNPRSYNSQVGVPLSVWQLEMRHELGIFEAGISQPKEMAKLAPIIAPTIGVFTNLGAAHDEGFASRKEKLEEKIKLFSSAEWLVYSADMLDIVEALQVKYPSKKHLTWGYAQIADLRLVAIEKENQRTRLVADYQGDRQEIIIPFIDEISIENAMHCWLLLLHFEVPPTQILERMQLLEPVAMRLELRSGRNGCLVINDSYNSDLTSLELALKFLAQQSTHTHHTLFLSDILQSGQAQEVLYQAVANLLTKSTIKRVVGIGNDVKLLASILPQSIDFQGFKTTNNFLQQLTNDAFTHETILLKGARRFEFERIADRLAQQVHQTVLEVNLNALTHNLKVYENYLKPETRLLVMVKASAYGSGSVEVAKLLEHHQVDYFGVAYADEGVELRQAGITRPILVLNSEAATFDALVRYQLEPEIYSLRQLRQLLDFLAQQETTMQVHLKLETGMNRLGFSEDDLEEVVHLLKGHSRIKIQSVFSHLAGSDEQRHDEFSRNQVLIFNKMFENLKQKLGYAPLRHILNSSGISRFSEYQMDMVRLGIGIYGIDGSHEIQSQLQVVNTLKATISQIKNLDKGSTVGYGRNGKIIQAKRTATISVGYADGLLRAAGNGDYSVFLHKKLASIVGNVCMDMCMIDVTDIPEAQEGDIVTIFGENPSVETLAKVLNTIPYEIFTNVSQRVKRIYIQE